MSRGLEVLVNMSGRDETHEWTTAKSQLRVDTYVVTCVSYTLATNNLPRHKLNAVYRRNHDYGDLMVGS